jgi:O-antigen ligase
MGEISAAPAAARTTWVTRSRVLTVAAGGARRAPQWLFHLLAVPFALAALVTLPRRLSLGPVSALAALTIAQLCLLGAAVIVLGRVPKRLLVSCVSYGGFLLVALISIAWAPPAMEGIQNGLVYALFGVGVLLGGALSVYEPQRTSAVVARGMTWIFWITLGIVVLQLARYGLPVVVAAYRNSGWYVTPRSIALVLLLSLGWHLSRWYNGSARAAAMSVALLAGQGATLSRLATATGVVLLAVMVILQVRFRPARMLANLPLLAGIVIAAAAIALYYEPVRRRMFEGDTSIQVGGIKVNASGRMELWAIVTASARQRPLLGHGLGSAQQLLGTQFSGEIAHPHNDYLRLWHDVGAIGAGLLLLAWGQWLVVLLRTWYRAERRRGPPASVSLAALLALLGLMATMLADNAVVYPFVMAPLGILVGTGLGPSLEQRREPIARRRPGIRVLPADRGATMSEMGAGS